MRQFRRQIFSITALLLFGVISTVGLLAQNGSPESEEIPAKINSFEELDDLIHFGDLIEIDVVGSSEFDWRGELTPDGTLGGLKFTDGPVFGLCRNSKEVAQAVKRNYSKFLNGPVVNVRILDRSKRPLAVLFGAVRMPQRFQLLREVTLQELIVLSGGFSENADGGIEIRRQPAAACTGLSESNAVDGNAVTSENAANIESEFREVKISEILRGDEGANVPIYYGDLVTVKSAPPVYVIGNVARPGRISMTKGLTVGRAIAAVGGVLATDDVAGIRIFRRNPGNTEIVELPENTVQTVDHQKFEIREYDIIEVFGGGPDRLKYPPVLQDPEYEDRQVDQLPVRLVN